MANPKYRYRLTNVQGYSEGFGSDLVPPDETAEWEAISVSSIPGHDQSRQGDFALYIPGSTKVLWRARVCDIDG